MTITHNEKKSTAHFVRELENECISHMCSNKFINPPPTPLDLTGTRVDFDGRGKDGLEIEWYIGRLRDDGGLLVTYNSHHDTIKNPNKHYVFNSSSDKPLDEAERESVKKHVAELQKKREQAVIAKEKERQKKATRDRDRFNKVSQTGTSAYLKRKRVGAHGVRFEIKGNETVLIIPMRELNEHGEIQCLQEIFDTKRTFGNDPKLRDKNFTNSSGGLVHVIGTIINGQQIRVSEGYATAVSCFESTGCSTPHVVAFSDTAYSKDGPDREGVVQILRRLYPDSPILICADGNKVPNVEGSGIREAKKAVAAVKNCTYVTPVFPEGKDVDENGERYKDFNDLMFVAGKEGVKVQIENATNPLNENEEDESLTDELIEEECDSADVTKARANARRRALMQQSSLDEIVKDINKQHSKLRDQSKDIASKALLWAKNYQTGSTVIVNGIPKTITDMKSLDTRLAQLEAPGQPCVIVNRKDALTITDTDLRKRLSGEVVVVGVNEKGQPKYLAANKFWEGNTHKYIYRNIVFTSKPTGKNDYNLFTGFGVKPKNGKCDKILAHIKEVICAGDEINNTALLKLLAWQMQNIGKPSRIITALKSKAQQIGKGTLLADILTPIYGNSGFATSEIGHIIGRFNDSIRGKAFIFLDECLFAGDRKAADAIKSLATAIRMGVEVKNIPTVQFPVAVNLFLSTNHDDAAHVEEADARYWILEVSPHRKGDTDYFEALYSEIEGGGREAFMHHLLNLDVHNFVPQRDVPTDNAAKDKMIRNSINPYDARKWIEECCLSKMILGCAPSEKHKEAGYPWELWQEGEEYENGIFSTAYTKWQSTVKSPVAAKPTAANNLGALLNAVGLDLRINGERRRTLPNPNDCLKKVTVLIEKIGKK